ncbi:hypothetical protein H9P43_002337 [Blastocladiella emersonii ATCC 22665]|nr:hypothetical protein H9P43_002337 [Blastocladiella emersonii ATCC 22665]
MHRLLALFVAIATLGAVPAAHAIVTDAALVYLPTAGRTYVFGGVWNGSNRSTSDILSIDLRRNFNMDDLLSGNVLSKLWSLPRGDRGLVPFVVNNNENPESVEGLGQPELPNLGMFPYFLPEIALARNFSGASRQAGIYASPALAKSQDAYVALGGRAETALVRVAFKSAGHALEVNEVAAVPTAAARTHGALIVVNSTMAVVTGGEDGKTGQALTDVLIFPTTVDAGKVGGGKLYPFPLNFLLKKHQSVVVADPYSDKTREYVVVVGDHPSALVEYFDPAAGKGPVAVNATNPTTGRRGPSRATPCDQINLLHVIGNKGGGLSFVWTKSWTPEAQFEPAKLSTGTVVGIVGIVMIVALVAWFAVFRMRARKRKAANEAAAAGTKPPPPRMAHTRTRSRSPRGPSPRRAAAAAAAASSSNNPPAPASRTRRFLRAISKALTAVSAKCIPSSALPARHRHPRHRASVASLTAAAAAGSSGVSAVPRPRSLLAVKPTRAIGGVDGDDGETLFSQAPPPASPTSPAASASAAAPDAESATEDAAELVPLAADRDAPVSESMATSVPDSAHLAPDHEPSSSPEPSSPAPPPDTTAPTATPTPLSLLDLAHVDLVWHALCLRFLSPSDCTTVRSASRAARAAIDLLPPKQLHATHADRVRALCGYAASGNVPLVRVLLTTVPSPNVRMSGGGSSSDAVPALVHAVRADRIDTARVLVEAGASPARYTRNAGTTPTSTVALHIAAKRGNIAMLRALIHARHADRPAVLANHTVLEPATKLRRSLVHSAIESRSVPVLRALVDELGARLLPVDPTEHGAAAAVLIALAVLYDAPAVLDWLLADRALPTADAHLPESHRAAWFDGNDVLALAAHRGNLDVVQRLLATDLPLVRAVSATENATTALDVAVDKDRDDLVRVLVPAFRARNAAVGHNCTRFTKSESKLRSYLLCAIDYGSLDLVRALAGDFAAPLTVPGRAAAPVVPGCPVANDTTLADASGDGTYYALCRAVSRGNAYVKPILDAVRQRYGADVRVPWNATPEFSGAVHTQLYGRSPLHFLLGRGGTADGWDPLLAEMLDGGARTDVLDVNGSYPLDIALRSVGVDHPAITELVKRGMCASFATMAVLVILAQIKGDAHRLETLLPRVATASKVGRPVGLRGKAVDIPLQAVPTMLHVLPAGESPILDPATAAGESSTAAGPRSRESLTTTDDSDLDLDPFRFDPETYFKETDPPAKQLERAGEVDLTDPFFAPLATPLFRAVARREYATARLLLRHGAQPNLGLDYTNLFVGGSAQRTSRVQRSPLAQAVLNGDAEMVALLLDEGRASPFFGEHDYLWCHDPKPLPRSMSAADRVNRATGDGKERECRLTPLQIAMYLRWALQKCVKAAGGDTTAAASPPVSPLPPPSAEPVSPLPPPSAEPEFSFDFSSPATSASPSSPSFRRTRRASLLASPTSPPSAAPVALVVPPAYLEPRLDRELDRYPHLSLPALDAIIDLLVAHDAPLAWTALPCHLVCGTAMDVLWARHDPRKPVPFCTDHSPKANTVAAAAASTAEPPAGSARARSRSRVRARTVSLTKAASPPEPVVPETPAAEAEAEAEAGSAPEIGGFRWSKPAPKAKWEPLPPPPTAFDFAAVIPPALLLPGPAAAEQQQQREGAAVKPVMAFAAAFQWPNAAGSSVGFGETAKAWSEAAPRSGAQ